MPTLTAQITASLKAQQSSASANQTRWAAERRAKHQKMLQAFLDMMGFRRKAKGDTLLLDGLTFVVRPSEQGRDAIVILGTCPQCGNDTHSDVAVSPWYLETRGNADDVTKNREGIISSITRATVPHFKPNPDHWKMCQQAYELRDEDPEAVEAWVRYATSTGDSGLFGRKAFFAAWHLRD